MSPYLFELCMEKLSVMIQNKVAEGSSKPIHVSTNGPGISHLLFADDGLLFCNGKISQVWMVMRTIEDFCKMSGLRINLEKSGAMASRTITSRKKDPLMQVTLVHFMRDIGKYLSIFILKGSVTRTMFNLILNRISSKLACWKSNLFNKACRVCLAKPMLSSFPIYAMQNL